MIYNFEAKKFTGETAVEIVRRLEHDTVSYENQNGTVREFLLWSLDRLADRIPARELDVSPDLDDETIAFNYLCLLDTWRIGTFFGQTGNSPESGDLRITDAAR